MGKYDAEKSAQLGMPVSTARSRLVKMLLFRELQRSGQDACFRCGQKIDDIDHLSIEHKEPWLHASPELFWDLDNIEFSHLTCNSLAARRPNKRFDTIQERDREAFKRYYADPDKRAAWNKRRNERRRKQSPSGASEA